MATVPMSVFRIQGEPFDEQLRLERRACRSQTSPSTALRGAARGHWFFEETRISHERQAGGSEGSLVLPPRVNDKKNDGGKSPPLDRSFDPVNNYSQSFGVL
uniref:Uncharacterized protein n=1 Tax=Pseudictyota dubia TaxID=2749911 RepID=A0A7R9ZG16_9STRA